MPETGPADFDHAHRAVVSLVWNLPKLPGQDSNLQPFTRTELARPFNYFAVQITTSRTVQCEDSLLQVSFLNLRSVLHCTTNFTGATVAAASGL